MLVIVLLPDLHALSEFPTYVAHYEQKMASAALSTARSTMSLRDLQGTTFFVVPHGAGIAIAVIFFVIIWWQL